MSGAGRPYLADACAVIVFFAERPMSERMFSAMSGPDVFVSPVTVWGGGGFVGLLERQGFQSLPLSWYDGEPANLLIVIASDRIFAAYGVRTIW